MLCLGCSGTFSRLFGVVSGCFKSFSFFCWEQLLASSCNGVVKVRYFVFHIISIVLGCFKSFFQVFLLIFTLFVKIFG